MGILKSTNQNSKRTIVKYTLKILNTLPRAGRSRMVVVRSTTRDLDTHELRSVGTMGRLPERH